MCEVPAVVRFNQDLNAMANFIEKTQFHTARKFALAHTENGQTNTEKLIIVETFCSEIKIKIKGKTNLKRNYDGR